MSERNANIRRELDKLAAAVNVTLDELGRTEPAKPLGIRWRNMADVAVASRLIEAHAERALLLIRGACDEDQQDGVLAEHEVPRW